MLCPGNRRIKKSLSAITVSIGTILLVCVLEASFRDSSQTLWPSLSNTGELQPVHDIQAERVALVVASQSSDNTTWLEESFPTWEKAVYLTDAPSNLSVPANRGRESMVYLT